MTFSERHRLPSRASPHASSRRRARVSVRLDILHCLPIRCIPHTTTHPSAPPAALDDAFDMAQTVYHGIGARERATQRPRIAIRAPPRRSRVAREKSRARIPSPHRLTARDFSLATQRATCTSARRRSRDWRSVYSEGARGSGITCSIVRRRRSITGIWRNRKSDDVMDGDVT